MGGHFQELDWRETAMGAISLRRRLDPLLHVEVYEVKLNDEFLMSSVFTEAEEELARLALADTPGHDLDVVVGGLGLGYTARAVLQDHRVRSLTIVEALPEVIGWHRRGLLPLATDLNADRRCHFTESNFFEVLEQRQAFGPATPHRCHAILVDIDHSPQHALHPSHTAFYTVEGLLRLADRLHPGGTFALWSDDPPDGGFLGALGEVFETPQAAVISFPNPYTEATSHNTVYLAKRAAAV